MASPTEAAGPCSVERAIIVEVYPESYQAEVQCLETNSEWTVSIPALSLNSDRGSGINYMPKSGDFCYLLHPADPAVGRIIIGYYSPFDSETGAKGERPTLRPGDLSLTTQDQNFVTVRRGGTVEIGASLLAQTVYIPIENVIRDYFQKYNAFSPIGEVVWDHAKISTGDPALDPTEKDIPALVKFSCRELINDERMSVEFRAGRLTEDILDTAVDSNLRPQDSGHDVKLYDGTSVFVDKTEFAKENDREHLFMASSQVGQPHPAGHPWKDLGAKRYEAASGDSSNSGLFSLSVTPSTTDINSGGTQGHFTFQVSKEGANFIRSESNIHAEAAAGFFVHASDSSGIRLQTSAEAHNKQYVEIRKYIRMETKKALMEMLENGEITIKADKLKKLNLIAGGTSIILDDETKKITMTAKTVDMHTDNVNMGQGASIDLLANASAWKLALENHVHVIKGTENMCPGSAAIGSPVGASGVTGIPIITPIPGAQLTSVTATKVKVKI